MQRVGRHSIGREIANSGLLATYEATHEDGRAVRLRVFDAGFRAEPSAVDRFEHDCSNAATVRHPSVDRPIAWSATYPVHVSTTLARSATLTEIYERAPSGRLDPGVVAGIGADVAEALNAVHAAGLVHAGLSPESVLLGTDGRAHVTDFGLMRFLNDMSATHSQVMRGSIESLTPEQLSAPDTVGPHTDVFGLGLLLYRTLTGKPAFDAPSALGMSIRISMGKVTPIDTHGIEMPAELSELVMKMLAAAPMNRPPIDHVVSVLTELAQKSGPWRDAVRTLAAEATPEAEAAPSVTPAGAEPPSTGALPEEEPAPFANPPQEAPRAPAETMETPQILVLRAPAGGSRAAARCGSALRDRPFDALSLVPARRRVRPSARRGATSGTRQPLGLVRPAADADALLPVGPAASALRAVRHGGPALQRLRRRIGLRRSRDRASRARNRAGALGPRETKP